jgi:hypothetical protein
MPGGGLFKIQIYYTYNLSSRFSRNILKICLVFFISLYTLCLVMVCIFLLLFSTIFIDVFPLYVTCYVTLYCDICTYLFYIIYNFRLILFC